MHIRDDFGKFTPNPLRSELISAEATPKKFEKRKRKEISPESPTPKLGKRQARDASPDRPVGVTRKGLERVQQLAEGLKTRCDQMLDQLEAFTGEIEHALAENLVRSEDEGPG